MHPEHLLLHPSPPSPAPACMAQSMYTSKDSVTGKYSAHKLKGEEVAVVDSVTLIGQAQKGAPAQRANIKLRFNRNPQIGDKFASRAGQKGVLSIL